MNNLLQFLYCSPPKAYGLAVTVADGWSDADTTAVPIEKIIEMPDAAIAAINRNCIILFVCPDCSDSRMCWSAVVIAHSRLHVVPI